MTYGLIAGIVLIFFGRELSLIFVNKSDAAVLTASAKYLFYAGFFYWTLGILNTCRMCTQVWIFWTCYILRSDGNDSSNFCKYDICAEIRLSCDLLHRSGGMDSGLLIHSSCLHILCEQGRQTHCRRSRTSCGK